MKIRTTLWIPLMLLFLGCPGPKAIVKITRPTEAGLVDQTEMIRGTSKGIPAGNQIWVVVFVQKVGRYYPQNQAADIQANGNWYSIAYIGIPADVGLKMDIIAVLADQQGQAAFAQYLQQAREKTDYAGLEKLPTGITVYDRISVIRK
jgi:hypothetical protein